MAASYVIHRPAVVAMLDAGIEILIGHLGGFFYGYLDVLLEVSTDR